jgi:predicted ATPase/class 3 adenylate cyclase
VPVCAQCGQENPEGFRFCGRCGAALQPVDAGPAREERKVVSVLFCDLVGFTSRAERLDPEDVRAVLGPYHARLRQELERYGGTVEKFIGDAVMAIFGAPTAHEDDPERAVRAALAIREVVAESGDLHVRIGIATGEALVNLGARPELGEGMAAGDVVNTAARLESAAPVDGILVDETTFRATERAIEYREHSPVEAKGKAEPVWVGEAVTARSRFGLDVGERTKTPLVGRRLELELLTHAFARARAERLPQLVTLVGVPGIGKSRLVLELFRHVDALPELVRWRQGRSLPYGEGATLWALAEIVKAEAGVLESDDLSAAAGKVGAAVREAVADRDEAAWVERHLRPLAGLEGGSTARDACDEAFAAWRRFFEGVAEQGPLVLVFEDLQWADDTLLAFVDHLVDWATDVPLLVVATARPELLATRPDWGGGKANVAIHSLAPLDDEETASLVHALLGRAVLPAEAQRSLLQRAGGNPLYAEEFARMLSERGEVDGAALPESVQGIIAARLDVLDAENKSLLQDAAVVGKVFWLGVLSALSGEERWRLEQRLHELERRELVRRDRQAAVGGERQYAFRHLLVREVAYGQIPRGRRAEKHEAAARWIEALSPDRSDDRADMLAHHWLAALRYAEAAGRDATALADRAFEAVVDAADRALGLNAAPAAVSLYEQALELLGERPPDPQLLLRYGRALYLAADERAAETLTEARDALAVAADREGEALAESSLSHLAWMRGDTEAARERSERAVALVEGLSPSPVRARVLAFAAGLNMASGQSEEAVALGRRAYSMADALELHDLRAHALASIGSARRALGDEAGIGDLEQAIEIAREVRSPEAARAAHNLGVSLLYRGRVDRFQELSRDAQRYAQQFGGEQIGRFLRGAAPSISYLTGDWEEAERLAEAFLQEAAQRPHYQEPNVLITRAMIRYARAEDAGARADAERTLALFETLLDRQARVWPLSQATRLYWLWGDRARARALAQELVVEWSTEELLIAAVAVAPFAHGLGIAEELEAGLRRWGRVSRWIDAALALVEARFAEAGDLLETIPSRPEEAQARYFAAGALRRAGRDAEADEQLRRALAFWRSVGARRFVREGEGLLAASA